MEDLSPCTYFGDFFRHKWIAVGWLEASHPYPQGDVDQKLFEKLIALAAIAWQPLILPGFHNCSLCPEGSDLNPYLRTLHHRYYSVAMGCRNLWIPSVEEDGAIYVAPSLIVHYVLKHHYRPPPPFCEAVLRCPAMWSNQYFGALESRGIDEVVIPRYSIDSVGGERRELAQSEWDMRLQRFNECSEEGKLQCPHSSRCLSLLLSEEKPHTWTCAIPDNLNLLDCLLLLEVSAETAIESLIRNFPTLVTLSSPRFIDLLMQRAISGLPLRHAPVPPPAVPVRSGCCYFQLVQTGPNWEAIKRHREVGVYVPADIHIRTLQMMIVKQR